MAETSLPRKVWTVNGEKEILATSLDDPRLQGLERLIIYDGLELGVHPIYGDTGYSQQFVPVSFEVSEELTRRDLGFPVSYRASVDLGGHQLAPGEPESPKRWDSPEGSGRVRDMASRDSGDWAGNPT